MWNFNKRRRIKFNKLKYLKQTVCERQRKIAIANCYVSIKKKPILLFSHLFLFSLLLFVARELILRAFFNWKKWIDVILKFTYTNEKQGKQKETANKKINKNRHIINNLSEIFILAGLNEIIINKLIIFI